MLGENFFGGPPTTNLGCLEELVSWTSAQPEHDNSVQNRMREAIEDTEVAETAPKLRAVSPRSSIVKRSAQIDSQRLTRQQKKQNWKHDGKY